MRKNGKINYWNHKKGYGFIEPEGGGETLFVHITSFTTKNKAPAVNSSVSFALGTGKDGRPCAVDVLQAGEKEVPIKKQEQQEQQQATPVMLWLIPVCIIAIIALYFLL